MSNSRLKKILYVTPHLSTGGLPQYLLKKIESYNNFFEIYCIEYAYYGPAYVVQRDRIIEILGKKFISLGEDKNELIKEIERISPDLIHFEEIPETFIENSILNFVYDTSRKYNICETCHSSTIETSSKFYKPDKFIMVSKWINDKFSHLGVPSELLEYPIEDLTPSRDSAIKYLGLDPLKKHIVNIGLFTPGKNQGELINYAKRLSDFNIEFHFVGNMADNFKEYWSPLIDDLPTNCKLWGERNDVDKFYQAADLFVFTSIFELNPLCIKESLSWKTPIIFRNLETYSNKYSDMKDVYYLSDDETKNTYKILEILGYLKSNI